MFVLSVVFLALLATAAAQPGFPRYLQGRWIFTNENPDYENTNVQSSAAEEHVLPETPLEKFPEVVQQVKPEAPKLLTTLASNAIKEQDKEEESAVWKIVLVVGVLLVSLVGAVSVAYYMCLWRGGRIYYQPQKEIYA